MSGSSLVAALTSLRVDEFGNVVFCGWRVVAMCGWALDGRKRFRVGMVSGLMVCCVGWVARGLLPCVWWVWVCGVDDEESGVERFGVGVASAMVG